MLSAFKTLNLAAIALVNKKSPDATLLSLFDDFITYTASKVVTSKTKGSASVEDLKNELSIDKFAHGKVDEEPDDFDKLFAGDNTAQVKLNAIRLRMNEILGNKVDKFVTTDGSTVETSGGIPWGWLLAGAAVVALMMLSKEK